MPDVALAPVAWAATDCNVWSVFWIALIDIRHLPRMVIYKKIDYAAQPNDLSSIGKVHIRAKNWAFRAFDFGG
jgi:hypothetical protein